MFSLFDFSEQMSVVITKRSLKRKWQEQLWFYCEFSLENGVTLFSISGIESVIRITIVWRIGTLFSCNGPL